MAAPQRLAVPQQLASTTNPKQAPAKRATPSSHNKGIKKPQTQQYRNPLKAALNGICILSVALHSSKVAYTRHKPGRRVDEKLTPINMSCFIARFYSLIRARESILDLACDADYEADVSALDAVVFPLIQSLIAAGNDAKVDIKMTSETETGEAVHVVELKDANVGIDDILSLFCADAFMVGLEDHSHTYRLEDFHELIKENGMQEMGKLGRAVIGNQYRGAEKVDFAFFVDRMVEGVASVEVGA